MKAVIVLLVSTMAVTVAGQQPPAAFEVASIRRNTTGQGGRPVVEGRRYAVPNQSVMGLLMGAYRLGPERILGAPDWTVNERYDINAQAAGNFADADLPAMLRQLLHDRFGFAGRRETREMPAFALVPAKAGALGPRLRRATIDCRDAAAVAKARAAATGSEPVCVGQANQTNLRFRGYPLESLARALAFPAGRLVVNRTGLDGLFDVDLDWGTLDNPDAVSIFTAVQDQLGLRLESTTAPFEVLVVERIQRPSEN